MNFLAEGIAVFLTGFAIIGSQDIWRTWLYKKLLHNQPITKQDYARQMMANEHELEQIRHEQIKAEELAKLAFIQANKQIMEQAAQAHVNAQTAVLLALPKPKAPDADGNPSLITAADLIAEKDPVAASKNGKGRPTVW